MHPETAADLSLVRLRARVDRFKRVRDAAHAWPLAGALFLGVALFAGMHWLVFDGGPGSIAGVELYALANALAGAGALARSRVWWREMDRLLPQIEGVAATEILVGKR